VVDGTYWTVTELLSGKFRCRSGDDSSPQVITISFSGDSRPAVGDTIITGGPLGYTMVDAISATEPKFRYMNFSKPEESAPESTQNSSSTVGEGNIKFATHATNSFRDIPAGTKMLEAKNGALVMAGEVMSGIAMTSSNKILLRDDNSMELVTPHYTALLGQTAVMSSFSEGFGIEIDMSPQSAATQNASPIQPLINQIHTRVKAGESYGTASKDVIGSSTGKTRAMVDLFGLHIADILCKAVWSRVKLTGRVGHAVTKYFSFQGLDFNQVGYYNDSSHTHAAAVSVEFFLAGSSARSFSSIKGTPPCYGMQDTMVGLEAETPAGIRVVTSLISYLETGDVITFATKLTSYVETQAIATRDLFISAVTHKSSATTFHRDHTAELFTDLVIGASGTGLCGQSVSFASLSFAGDTTIVVEGELNLLTHGDMTMQSPTKAKIIAAGRGLLIDSSGVSTVS